MKLLRYGPPGQEKPGLVDRDGRIRDLSGKIKDVTPDVLAPGKLEELARIDPNSLPLVDGKPRLGSCVANIPKLVCVGLNYQRHAEESGAAIPETPVLFSKFGNAVAAHGEPVPLPAVATQYDYEAELAVVIGRRARRVPQSEAPACVLGYTCGNDVSARNLQFGDKQWVRGKSLDTFCPLGPVLVTSDDIPDPQALAVRCLVNGEVLQEGTTGDMIFPVARLVEHASQAFTLEPGDVIMTGTPPGVGVFRDPQRFLRDGDEVAVEIEGIGRLVNVCREESWRPR